jgi:hypothetical protein
VEAAGAFQQQFLDKFSKTSNPGPLTTAGRAAASNQFRDMLSGNSDGRRQGRVVGNLPFLLSRQRFICDYGTPR